MELEISLASGNAIFSDARGGVSEAVRILRELADKIEAGADIGPKVYDVTGNPVGTAYFEPSEG